MPELLHGLPAAPAQTPAPSTLPLHDHQFMWQFSLTDFHPTSTTSLEKGVIFLSNNPSTAVKEQICSVVGIKPHHWVTAPMHWNHPSWATSHTLTQSLLQHSLSLEKPSSPTHTDFSAAAGKTENPFSLALHQPSAPVWLLLRWEQHTGGAMGPQVTATSIPGLSLTAQP